MTVPMPIHRGKAEIGAVPTSIDQEKIKAGAGEMKEKNDLGVQPLDALMTKHVLTNHALVAASTEQLSHKVVQKARTGRRLTSRAKTKILNALHNALPEHKFAHRDLFNY